MSYKLLQISSLSALGDLDSNYTIYPNDILMASIGTQTGALSSVKLTVGEITENGYYSGNTGAAWISAGTGAAKKIYVDGNYSVGIGTDDPKATLDVTGTDAIIVPAGTTVQRPTAETGMIRYNSTISSFEGYHASTWSSLGGVKDVDQDTYITAEDSAGADNDELDFYIGVSSSAVKQITLADGVLYPVTDDDIDLGTSTLEFKDLFLDGTAHIDTLDVDINATITGNLDVDGTTNLDVVDIDGAVQLDGTLTIGVNDTGYDVKLFGASSGKFILWDESADSLKFTDTTYAQFGTGLDMSLYHDGTNSYITNAVGALKVATETSGIAVTIGHTTSEVTVADNLTVAGTLNVTGETTLATHLNMGDNDYIKLGTGSDLQLYHDGSNSYATNAVGDLVVINAANDKDIKLQTDDGSGSYVNYFMADGSSGEALLYHYGSAKLATKSGGVLITGELESTTLDVNGAGDISGALALGSTLTVTGTTTLNGAVNLGNATGDSIAVTGLVSTNIVPDSNNDQSLGLTGARWDAYIDKLYVTDTAVVTNLNADKLDGEHLWSSANNWDVIPYTTSAGNTKVGRYLDFFNSDAGSGVGLTLETLGTSSDLYINGTDRLYNTSDFEWDSQKVALAWAKFDHSSGSGGTGLRSFNVNAIVNSGTGIYDIYPNTTMSGQQCILAGMYGRFDDPPGNPAMASIGIASPIIGTPTTTYVRLVHWDYVTGDTDDANDQMGARVWPIGDPSGAGWLSCVIFD